MSYSCVYVLCGRDEKFHGGELKGGSAGTGTHENLEMSVFACAPELCKAEPLYAKHGEHHIGPYGHGK